MKRRTYDSQSLHAERSAAMAFQTVIMIALVALAFAGRLTAAVLSANTFLGSSTSDEGKSIAVDGSGNLYVTGRSLNTWGSPVTGHGLNWDAFVAKLSGVDGSLIWNTFVGGNGSEYGEAITVDASGNVYIVGESTGSWGTPVRAYTASTDAFAAKLSSTGSLLWNTFLGGSAVDYGKAVAVDGTGNVCVGGWSDGSWGSPLRPYTAGSDGWAAKLASDGSLVGNSFLGGGGLDLITSIAVDAGGDVYVSGWSTATWGSPVRPYTADHDSFAAKFASSGPLLWSTFLDGAYGTAIAVDSGGSVYVAGTSYESWGSPVRAHSGGDDAYVAKVGSTDGSLTWNTFLGGGGDESCLGMALGGNGAVYVGGYGDATWGSPLRAYTAGDDSFVAAVGGDGRLWWSSFLGGVGDDLGYGVAADSAGNVYVSGISDATWGSPARAYSGSDDAFVAIVSGAGPIIIEINSKTATRGGRATLKGFGFSNNISHNTVQFGKKKATIVKAKPTSLKVTIPSKAKKGTNNVKVVTDGIESNVFPFQVK